MTEDNSYTRVRYHAQRGDGPDQRGECTVEVSRSTEEARPHTVRVAAEKEFSDAVDALEDELGL